MQPSLPPHSIDRLTGGAGPHADVPSYDFRRPPRISKERLRTLEAMYERVAKALERWLVSRVRCHVELRLQGVEQCSFGEFVRALPAPCAAYVFDVRDGDGAQGVVHFGVEFAFFLVDRLFGGSGKAAVLDRALSPVERLVVRTVAERTCQLLEEVWRDHVPLTLDVAGFESSPEMLQIANREDPVLVATVEVHVDGAGSPAVICLPFGALEKFFQSTGQRRVGGAARDERAREEARLRAEQALRSTPVTVAARLPAFQLTLRELSALVPGQVIATGIQCDAPLSLLVGGRPRYTGSAGRVGRHLAVRLGDATGPADAGEFPPAPAEDRA